MLLIKYEVVQVLSYILRTKALGVFFSFILNNNYDFIIGLHGMNPFLLNGIVIFVVREVM